MMTMGSLFDGIGGFPLAAVHNGITPVWASEIEAFPIKVTKIRFPDMLHVGDITKLNGATLPPVDVICGGSPCQDYAEKIVIPRYARHPCNSKGFRENPRDNKIIAVRTAYAASRRHFSRWALRQKWCHGLFRPSG